jgi:hypothetical protein
MWVCEKYYPLKQRETTPPLRSVAGGTPLCCAREGKPGTAFLISICLYVSNFRTVARKAFGYFAASMSRFQKVIAAVILVLGPILSFGQNIDGHWYGVGVVQNSNSYNSYMSEMVIRQKGKVISGTLNYYFKDSLIKVAVNGSFDPSTRKLSIKPFQMIYYLSPNARNSIDCYMSGNFTLITSKTETVLSGNLISDADHKYTTPPIGFKFQKSNDTADLVMLKDEPEELVKQDPVIAPAVIAPVVAVELIDFTKRAKVFTKELDLENNSIRLELYDNGEIDYDSVTLFLNSKMILPKTMLTHRAIRLTIELDPSLEYNELSMFANNLGMKPPNTAALILYDGKIRYETLLSSDLNKSASLKLKKKQ